MNTMQPTKWSAAAILTEARRRTNQIHANNTRRVQRMLAGLCKEAGWSDDELLDALVRDVTLKAGLAKTRPVTDLLRKLA